MTPAMKFWPALLLLGAFTVFIQCRPEDTAPFVPELRFPIDISKEETEANSTFEFPLVLNQSTTRDIVVRYETRELTALEGEDYIPVADSLVIPAGTASASIFVDIVVDDYLEEDEQFRVVLTGSTNAILAGGIRGGHRHHPQRRLPLPRLQPGLHVRFKLPRQDHGVVR